MQERKKIPSKPRFDYVTKKAYELLFELGYDKFPITAEQVLEDLSDFIVCLPWSKAREVLNSDDPFHLHETKADARSIKRRDCDTYFIVYDDYSGSVERTNWTILHEIGHILLGHLDDFGVTSLDRGGLTSKAYGVLEVETNWFVAEFLMPTPVIRSLGRLSADKIALIFGVSDEASYKKYERVYEKPYVPTQYDEKLVRHFYRFITKGVFDTIYHRIHSFFGVFWTHKADSECRRCNSCKSYIRNPRAKYCFHCGSLIKSEPYVFPMGNTISNDDTVITHPFIPHRSTWEDKNGDRSRVGFCPNCLNQELEEDADYCSICGATVHNECTVEHIDLPLDSSFCPSCGAPASIGNVYSGMENRLHAIENWTSPQFEDYLEYEHWQYMKMKIATSAAFYGSAVIPALFYTNAFLDDDDNLIIITDTQSAVDEITKNSDKLTRIIERYGSIEPSIVSVKLIETT